MYRLKAKDALDQGLIKNGVKFYYTNNGTTFHYKVQEEIYKGSSQWVKVKEVNTGKLGTFYIISEKYIVMDNKGGSIFGRGKDMLGNVTGEVKDFIGENKSLLYTLAVIFVVDYYIFNGKFKDKLENIFKTVIDKASTIIEKADKKEGEKVEEDAEAGAGD